MTQPTELESTDFPASRRIVAGVGWGLLWGGGISVVLFPILPTSTGLIFFLCVLVLTSITIGISLYWNAVRSPCPKCETIFTATPNGSQCPGCGQRVRASDGVMIER